MINRHQTDSYVRSSATVVAVDGPGARVALDRTAFYPGGGGQPCDTGALQFGDVMAPVVKVGKEGDLAWHSLGPLSGFLTCRRRAR
jgi:misacylated tRNA(Ala) deacylase